MEEKIEKGRRRIKIYCKKCGAERWVTTANYRAVELCIKCYDEKRRAYNQEYIKKRRAQKREANLGQATKKTGRDME